MIFITHPRVGLHEVRNVSVIFLSSSKYFIVCEKRRIFFVKPKSEVPKSKVPKSRAKEQSQRTWADTIITWATTLPHNLSMKECSGKKVLIVKVVQNDPFDSSSQKNDQVDSEIKDMG